jgi:hypothetical protein
VVAGPAARGLAGHLCGDEVGDGPVVEQLLRGRHDTSDPVETRLVAHQQPQGDVALVVGVERGPPRRERFVVAEQAPVDQSVDHRRGDPLGGREAHRGGVTLPGALPVGVGVPDPDVDDGFATPVHREGTAAVGGCAVDASEPLDERAETAICVSLDHVPTLHRAGPRHVIRRG